MPVRYSFDNLNRLILRDPSDRLRPTRVLEGRVRTDAKNRLIYRIDSTSASEPSRERHQLELDGTWKLTPTHELALALHKTQEHDRQTLYLKAGLLDAQPNALTVTLRQQHQGNSQAAQRLTLWGRWVADTKNRLTFLAERADGAQDRLTFQGGWEVGKHHELIYRYRQHEQRRGRRTSERTIIFTGAWDLTRADRLVYRLAGSSNSAFEFKASLQSPSLTARDGRLVYQAGIGLSGGRTRRQQIELFGTWKLHRDLSVSFEIPYAQGRIQAVRFEGTYALSPRDRFSVALRTRHGEPLGLTVTFTKELLPDASVFLRIRKEAKEQEVLGGVTVRF